MSANVFAVFALLVCFSVASLWAQDQIQVQHVHLSLASSDESEMYVSWFTRGVSQSYVPTVKYGTASKRYDFTIADGKTQTYDETSGYTHFVRLAHLKPNTTYYYVCGTEDMWSREFVFTTSSAASNEQKFFILGDMGIEVGSMKVTKRVHDKTLSNRDGNLFWLLVGDISYADNHPFSEYEPVMNTWFVQNENITSRIPLMVLPGNHERNTPLRFPKTHVDFRVYNSRFVMPSLETSHHNMYYSVDIGKVHYVFTSTETDYPNAPYNVTFGDQMKWLQEDLKAANSNREQVPWIICLGHRPIYSSHNQYSTGDDPINDSKVLQTAFEDLFKEYKVDMYFAGHVHSYERTKPVYKSRPDATATTYIVAGAAGNPEGLTQGTSFHPTAWSAHKHWVEEGYGMLTATATSLRWQYFRVSDDGLEDEVLISKHKRVLQFYNR